MDKDIFRYISIIGKILTDFEAKHGSLELLSSRNTEKTSRIIDEITCIMTTYFKFAPQNIFKMYNIKIFVEDNNFKTIHTIPLSVRCYNYLFLNTNFSSQYLLKKDLRLGLMTGVWPTLSPYLFLQIIWNSKCEDLLVESLLHIPLDLCVQILKVTIKHIHELDYCLQARRHIFLLIYRIYCKCLWLHLGTMSDQSVVKCISQLVIYFQKFLNMLANPMFRICRCHSRYDMGSRFAQHGILVKYTLRYIKKCMHSKTESVSENRNLAKLFTLTYGHFNERKNYHHKLPVSEVKSIVLKLEKKLAIFLLNLIKQIDCSEYISWQHMDDDENNMISLQHAIVTECCHFIKFMKQNKFLVTNKYLSHCLEQLRRHIILPRKSTLTLSELCHDIEKGNLHSMKELAKRYKEWDLSVLNFLMTNVEILRICDGFAILEYLHHKFAYLHTNAQKYQFYVSVLQILIQLPVKDMNYIVQSYVQRHFYDNPLECLYNEECLTRFMDDTSYDQNDNERVQFQLRVLLTFILLNSRKVLSKFVMYEISEEFANSSLFEPNMAIFQNYYRLNKGRYNILIYILKDLIFQQRIVLGRRYLDFLDNAMRDQMIEADDIINELYITYLANGSFDTNTISLVLSHVNYMFVTQHPYRIDYLSLMKVLSKTASLLKRYVPFLKRIVSSQLKFIDLLLSYMRNLSPLKNSVLHEYIHNIEPLEITKLQPTTNTLNIIQEYERRCFVVHQRLRTNPRCHPKLRSYLQSFNLNQETFIRHMILQYSYAYENEIHMFDLTFTFFHHFGWVNPITAYENMVRIIAEASQIALTYEKTFPKNMFSSLLNRIVQFSKIVESNMLDSQDVIRNVLLKTLSSMDIMICNTSYATMYSFLLNSVQNLGPSLPRTKYFDNIHRLIYSYLHEYIPETMSPRTRINNISLSEKYLLIEKNIASMYNAYLFICECTKLYDVEIHTNADRLLHKLCLE